MGWLEELLFIWVLKDAYEELNWTINILLSNYSQPFLVLVN